MFCYYSLYNFKSNLKCKNKNKYVFEVIQICIPVRLSSINEVHIFKVSIFANILVIPLIYSLLGINILTCSYFPMFLSKKYVIMVMLGVIIGCKILNMFNLSLLNRGLFIKFFKLLMPIAG